MARSACAVAAVGTTPPRVAGRRTAIGATRLTAATSTASASPVFRLASRRSLVRERRLLSVGPQVELGGAATKVRWDSSAKASSFAKLR